MRERLRRLPPWALAGLAAWLMFLVGGTLLIVVGLLLQSRS